MFRFKMLILIFLVPNFFSGSEAAVTQLTSENFDDFTASGAWLLVFYAPWCGHCKQLTPILEEASEEADGLNFGRVDCTTQSELSSKYDIGSYPTLKFLRDGEVRPYRSGRKKENFIDFADVISAPAIRKIDQQNYIDVLEEHQVVFLLHGLTPECEKLFLKAARRYQGILGFAQNEDETLLPKLGLKPSPEPYVVVLTEDGEKHQFFGPWEYEDLAEFIEKHQLPLVSILELQNFESVTSTGKLTAIAVINVEEDNTDLSVAMHSVAKARKDEFIFGSIDGIEFSSWVERFSIYTSDLPTVFIFDAAEQQYYLCEGFCMSENAINDFLDKVLKGEIPVRGSMWYSPSRWIRKGEEWLSEHFTEDQITYIMIGIFISLFGLVFYSLWADKDTPRQHTPLRNHLKKKTKKSGKAD